MLQISNLYRVQLLLGKIKETEMHAECAILYGKVLSLTHIYKPLWQPFFYHPPTKLWEGKMFSQVSVIIFRAPYVTITITL